MTIPVPEQATTKSEKNPPVTKPRGTDSRQPGSKAGGRASKPAKTTSKASLARPGTKADKILTLLRRPDGASLQELRKATGWQAHSVRGFLSGVVKTKFGYRVHSSKKKNGERVYRIAAK